MAKQYYQLIQGKSAKYWHIELAGESLTSWYGRIGTAGRTTTKSFQDHAGAKAASQKVIDEKVNKGYQKVTARQAAEHRGASGSKKKPAKTARPKPTKKSAAKPSITKKKVAGKKTERKGTPKGKTSAKKPGQARLELTPLLKKLKKHARGADARTIGQLLRSKSPKVGHSQLLFWAGKWQAADVVGDLMDANFDFNKAAQGKDFWTVSVTVTKLVIDGGLNVKQHAGHWLRTASWQGKTRVVELLLEAGAKPNTEMLLRSIEEGRTEVVRLLIAGGVNVDKPLAKGKESPLMEAAKEGKLEIVRLLLEAGADPFYRNENGFDALMDAGRGKGADGAAIVQLLLERGADADFVTKVGWTPLHWAARSGTPQIIRLLVKHGADVNRVTSSGTALSSAASENRGDQAAVLLELGADPQLKHPGNSHKEWRGMNALDVARYWKARKVIPILEAAIGGGKTKAKAKDKKKVTTVAGSWKRIEKWLADNDEKDRLKSLAKPAKGDQIEKLEKTLGVTLPADVKQSYKIHDGQSYLSSLIETDREGSYYLLSVKEIQQEWKAWKSLVDIDEFAGQTSSPDEGIRGDQWYNLKWIPVFSNGGGDSYCVDLAPAKGGKKGQIISMNHESGDRTLIAASLSASQPTR